MKELIFTNTFYDEPIIHKIMIGSIEDAKPIMEWYGAFHANDPYTVMFDGNFINMDLNGEFEPLTIDAERI